MRRMRRRMLHMRCDLKLRFLNMFITVFLVIEIHLYLQIWCVVLIWSEIFLLAFFFRVADFHFCVFSQLLHFKLNSSQNAIASNCVRCKRKNNHVISTVIASCNLILDQSYRTALTPLR
jgi:hypothetical protein